MSFDYASIRGTATSLIKTFGQSAVLQHRRDDVDPATGVNVPTIEEYAVTVVVGSYSKRAIEAGLVSVGDQNVLMSGETIDAVHESRDRLIIGDKKYQIIRVEEVTPGGTNVLYDMQVRREG